MSRSHRGRTHLLVVGLVAGLGGAGCMAATPAQPPEATGTVPVLAMTLKPAKGEAFGFGQVAGAVFTLTNLSGKAVVVTGIRPTTNQAEETIRLSSTAYGSLTKDKTADLYVHHVMTQRATQLPFYVGFLLPGQKVLVACRYRPLFSAERFRVAYAAAGIKYRGTADSLRPFTVYVLRADVDRSTPRMKYEPFTDEAWRLLSKARHVSPPGPGVSTRGVLIPNLRASTVTQEVEISVAFAGQAFPAEKASKAAAKIAKAEPGKLKLAYSAALGGYAVTQGRSAWLLTRADQTAPGKALPIVPPALLRDVDSPGDPSRASGPNGVRIRIGKKQKGLGPEKRLAKWKLWGKYPVEYGDGMYTRGEFIRIDKDALGGFLEEIRKRGTRLKTHPYYFRSRYFVIDPEPKRPEEGTQSPGSLPPPRT